MKKLALDIPSERIIGFTIPRDGLFYVCDHDEVWTVLIGSSLTTEETQFEPYGFMAGRSDFVGWGQAKNRPILKHGDTEIRYDFDGRRDHVTVRYVVAGYTGEIEFRTLSGDWFAASLSADGAFLVLAEPYSIEFYEIR